ncbi:hypothetical protein C8J57DRAFT_1725629 [Mycena rebaudengoi]|nr:hypothetical protein C8J57DRAFT_1725629 [Mycena rebaudengoi]
MAIVLSCWTPQQALPYSFKSIHHLSASVFTVLFLLCAPLALPSNCSRNPTPNAPIYFPTTRRLLLMDDADFRATYKVPASAPANRAPQPTLAALGLVAPGSSSHSLLAPTHPLIAPIATITTQHPHPALAASGPLTTADGTCSPPTTTHTPSSVALGKRCLVEILFDDEADPVASTSTSTRANVDDRQIHLADMDIKFVAVHASSLANLVSYFSHFSPALSNDDVGKLVELKCEWRRYDHDMERKVLLVHGILALHVAIV